MPIPQIIQPATGLAPGLNLSINDYRGPASYVQGGTPVSANVFGLQSIKTVHAMELSVSGNFFVKFFSIAGLGKNSVTSKWFVQGTGVEVGAGINLSAETVRCLALGI